MKRNIQKHFRQALTGLVVLVQVSFYPAAAFAQDVTADVPPTESETQSQAVEDTSAPAAPEQPVAPAPEEPVSPTEPTSTGEQQPTGAASSTYVFNPDTGLWENDYYTWDPVTKQTKAKVAPDYSYNPGTGMWDTTEWYYSPETGKYEPNVVSSAVMPAGATMPQALSISDTGPNSNNTISVGGTNTGTFDLFFNASISNKIGQLSRSGDASVQGNTSGGSALTGDALAIATLLNMLQSSWGELGSEDIALFVANVDGDVTGDLYVDPGALFGGSGNTEIDVNVSSDAAIHNDIDVDVASGDALVANNTQGGDATSGSARAVVNLLNLINSAIKSGKSFVGVLNINGNLNGDILLPPEMIQAIIAASGPDSNNQITTGQNTTVDVTSTDNKTINNDISTDVGSGDADVSGNTTGGDATTGKAESNIVLLNLTGKKVVAKNALLVFVNVMGTWVGLIYDAPAGTNAIAATGPGSNNTIDSDGSLDVEVDVTTNSLIDNDVDVAAHSGDASVTGNTKGGNATTGDASIGVNVLNMIDSEFDIEDWFGVLFINVFGSWVGSFGVNTEAGNQPANVGVVPPAVANTAATTVPQTFRFAPQPDASNTGTTAQGVVAGATDQATPPSVLPASSVAPAQTANVISSNAASNSGMNIWVAGLITFIGALMLGGERLISIIRSRYA